MRLCYDCVLARAARTGRAALGNVDGHGRCEECGVNRLLYIHQEIGNPRLTTVGVYKAKHSRIGFGWALVILAIAIAVAFFLASLDASGSQKLTHLEWCERALFRLPVYHEDQPPGGVAGKTAEKQEQLRAIAREVARVSEKAPLPPRKWAALLITIGFHESTYSLRIFAGNCKKWECDRGKARSAWQVHRSVFTEPYWHKLWGMQNVDSQVDAADAVLRRHLQTCGPTPAGIFTAYMGKRCGSDVRQVQERVATFERTYR